MPSVQRIARHQSELISLLEATSMKLHEFRQVICNQETAPVDAEWALREFYRTKEALVRSLYKNERLSLCIDAKMQRPSSILSEKSMKLRFLYADGAVLKEGLLASNQMVDGLILDLRRILAKEGPSLLQHCDEHEGSIEAISRSVDLGPDSDAEESGGVEYVVNQEAVRGVIDDVCRTVAESFSSQSNLHGSRTEACSGTAIHARPDCPRSPPERDTACQRGNSPPRDAQPASLVADSGARASPRPADLLLSRERSNPLRYKAEKEVTQYINDNLYPTEDIKHAYLHNNTYYKDYEYAPVNEVLTARPLLSPTALMALGTTGRTDGSKGEGSPSQTRKRRPQSFVISRINQPIAVTELFDNDAGARFPSQKFFNPRNDALGGTRISSRYNVPVSPARAPKRGSDEAGRSSSRPRSVKAGRAGGKRREDPHMIEQFREQLRDTKEQLQSVKELVAQQQEEMSAMQSLLSDAGSGAAKLAGAQTAGHPSEGTTEQLLQNVSDRLTHVSQILSGAVDDDRSGSSALPPKGAAGPSNPTKELSASALTEQSAVDTPGHTIAEESPRQDVSVTDLSTGPAGRAESTGLARPAEPHTILIRKRPDNADLIRDSFLVEDYPPSAAASAAAGSGASTAASAVPTAPKRKGSVRARGRATLPSGTGYGQDAHTMSAEGRRAKRAPPTSRRSAADGLCAENRYKLLRDPRDKAETPCTDLINELEHYRQRDGRGRSAGGQMRGSARLPQAQPNPETSGIPRCNGHCVVTKRSLSGRHILESSGNLRRLSSGAQNSRDSGQPREAEGASHRLCAYDFSYCCPARTCARNLNQKFEGRTAPDPFFDRLDIDALLASSPQHGQAAGDATSLGDMTLANIMMARRGLESDFASQTYRRQFIAKAVDKITRRAYSAGAGTAFARRCNVE